MSSTLNGVIADLRAGRPLHKDQVDEIGRVLDALRAEGWSGYMTADEAVKALAGEEGDE